MNEGDINFIKILRNGIQTLVSNNQNISPSTLDVDTA